jgi:hypothetical protein
MTRPEREGKKQVSAFVTVEKWRKLRNIATNTERTHTDLIAEAIDDLAAKYGEPQRSKVRQAPRRGKPVRQKP